MDVFEKEMEEKIATAQATALDKKSAKILRQLETPEGQRLLNLLKKALFWEAHSEDWKRLPELEHQYLLRS